MQVVTGGGNIGVSQKLLGVVDVDAVLQQMDGDVVTQGVQRNLLLDSSGLLCLVEYIPMAHTGFIFAKDARIMQIPEIVLQSKSFVGICVMSPHQL